MTHREGPVSGIIWPNVEYPERHHEISIGVNRLLSFALQSLGRQIFVLLKFEAVLIMKRSLASCLCESLETGYQLGKRYRILDQQIFLGKLEFL